MNARNYKRGDLVEVFNGADEETIIGKVREVGPDFLWVDYGQDGCGRCDVRQVTRREIRRHKTA